MKTAFGYQISPNLIKYNTSIRSKADIIRLLIAIVRYLNIASPNELEKLTIENRPGDIVLILHVDKMSRIFISDNDKIHTFQFPFSVGVSDGKLHIAFNGIQIDNGVVSILNTALSEFEDWYPLEQIIEKYWEAIDDFEISKAEAQIYNGMITYLLSFEPGYLRFDYDQDNKSNERHPLNHLDIYYTNKNTFKIGLLDKLNHIQLIDILNISTPCLTLK
jgi:hypothetical protein